MSAGGLNGLFGEQLAKGVIQGAGGVTRSAFNRAKGTGRSISKTVFDGEVDPAKPAAVKTPEQLEQERRAKELQGGMTNNKSTSGGYRAPNVKRGMVSSVLNLSGQTLTGS